MINGSIKIGGTILIAFLLAGPVVCLASEARTNLELTSEEQKWLDGNPVVKFTGDPNWLPYEAFNEKGEYIGIVAEHLLLIAKLTGLNFEMSPSKTWTESTEKAKQGKVDILSETDDSDLASHLNFTQSYVSNPIVIAMQDKEHYVENLNSIKNRSIGVIKDYGYVSKILRKYKNHKFVVVDDIQDGLVSVSTGRIDALLCTAALCSYTIGQLGLNNVKITGKTEFDTKLALGVQKDLPELLSILNKAIKKITPGQRQAILDGWIKQKFVPKTDYTLAYQIFAVAVVLLAIFFFWNRRLSREINLRIATENELKKAQEHLRLSQQRLVSHLENTPLAVIEWDTDFKVVNWNSAAQRIFGYSKEEVIGWHASGRILPEEARFHVDKVWNQLLANKGGARSTNENITKDGRTIICEWYNTPLVNPDGKVIGVASLVDDITERVKTEQELEQYRNQLEMMVSERTAALEVANKELEAFSYSVSHDLRSPLRAIDGFSYALIDDYDELLDEDGRILLQRIRGNAQHMGKLIDAILSLSRVTRSDYRPELVNLSELVKATIRRYQEEDPGRNVKVVIEPGLFQVADKPLMSIVLDNLIGNAWKYSSKNSNAKIEFGSFVKDGKTGYYVRDNGVGFEMKYVNKLFSAFQRLHKAEDFEGTGIGLVTVSRIIRRHSGEVWAEAVPGKGATFYFTLGPESAESGGEKKKQVAHA